MVNVVACQVYMHSGRCSSQAGRSAFNTMVNAVACQVYMHSGRCSSQAGRSAFNTMVNAVACQDYMCILVGAADRLAGLHSTQWSMQLHVKSTCVFLWVQLTGWPVCTQTGERCSSLARNKLSWAGLAHRRNILASLPENLMQSHFKNASNRPYHKCKESKVGGRHIRHAHDLFHKHFITSI